MKKENKTVAIYVRVSTDKQEAENQLIQLRKYCKNKKYKIFGEYIDVMSGKTISRPKFNQMFDDAHKQLFNMILFWDISRFSRSGIHHTITKLKELDNLDIVWKSYQDKYFDSAGQYRDMILSIMAEIAKIEAQKISDRTKAGLRRARLSGKKLGRPGLDPRKIDEVKKIYADTRSIRKTSRLTKVSYSKCWNIIKGGAR